jgi:hypothetical protein
MGSHLALHLFAFPSLSSFTVVHGGVMTLSFVTAQANDATLNLGPLALIVPLLEQLDIAAIIDRHLPADPQLEFSHGKVLSLLLAARLCQPNALISIPEWAHEMIAWAALSTPSSNNATPSWPTSPCARSS